MKKRLFALIGIALCLASCGVQDGENKKNSLDSRKVLELAIFEQNAEVSKQVTIFNQNNKNYKIEIKKYDRTTQTEGDGIAKLQRDIMSGNGPDIIDFGEEYSTSDVIGEYTEDLYPYIKAEIEQKKDDYFMNILDAFSYKDKLYAMPISFKLQTFAGSSDLLGNRTYWNIEEMIQCYQEQDKEMLLYPGQFKKDVLGTILNGNLDYYIDWEKGTCNFNGDEFQKVMSFSNTFSDTLNLPEDFSLKQTYWNGGALLLPLKLTNIYSIGEAEYIIGEEDINYIGFPVEEGCGTFIKPSYPILAISISSKNNDVSWEFISQFLGSQSQGEIEDSFPIRKSALDEKIAENLNPEYTTASGGTKKVEVKDQIKIEGDDPVNFYNITETQADKLLNLIASTDRCTTTDYSLYNIILEEASSYFEGDKTLEEACDIIQSRASVYVSERVK